MISRSENPFSTPNTDLEGKIRAIPLAIFTTMIGGIGGAVYTFLDVENSLRIINYTNKSWTIGYDHPLVRNYIEQTLVANTIYGALVGLIVGVGYNVYR